MAFHTITIKDPRHAGRTINKKSGRSQTVALITDDGDLFGYLKGASVPYTPDGGRAELIRALEAGEIEFKPGGFGPLVDFGNRLKIK